MTKLTIRQRKDDSGKPIKNDSQTGLLIGSWYVVTDNPSHYLHADGMIRLSTRHDEKYTGLFNTREDARKAIRLYRNQALIPTTLEGWKEAAQKHNWEFSWMNTFRDDNSEAGCIMGLTSRIFGYKGHGRSGAHQMIEEKVGKTYHYHVLRNLERGYEGLCPIPTMDQSAYSLGKQIDEWAAELTNFHGESK